VAGTTTLKIYLQLAALSNKTTRQYAENGENKIESLITKKLQKYFLNYTKIKYSKIWVY